MLNDLAQQKIGVVGANGFVGSAILASLLQSHIAPRALCGPIEIPRPLPVGVEFATCDLCDAKSVTAWVSGLDVVIHAAGPPSVQQSFEISGEYLRVHVQGTATLLQACRMSKVSRFVYISSAEVYGRPEANPVAEAHRLQARSPYAAAKIGAEKMIEAYVESFGLQAVILRPFSIYGPRASSDGLLARIAATAKSGCIRVRDLRPVRDYCYVNDVAQAVVRACDLQSAGLQIFNIGSGKGTSVEDLAKLAAKAMNIDSDIPIVEERTAARPGQSEIFELIADINSARDVLQWAPTTGLFEGLRLTLTAASNSL